MPTIGDSAWAEKKPLTTEEAPVNASLRSTMGGKRATWWPDTLPCFFLFSLVLLAPVFSFVSLSVMVDCYMFTEWKCCWGWCSCGVKVKTMSMVTEACPTAAASSSVFSRFRLCSSSFFSLQPLGSVIPYSAASGSKGWLLKTVKTMVNAGSRLCAFVRWVEFASPLLLVLYSATFSSVMKGQR
uniref:Uncharacterized protein n=1 Tax=Populus alba TaxID=43335 RepID=A0A4U5MNQ4_POPAL|nr:hypothetical protein D5086_0000303280 [Populus alba]